MTLAVLIGGAVVAIALVVVWLSRNRDVTVVQVPPPRPSSAQPPVVVQGRGPVQDLLQAGEKIEAIKRYRELTGVGLKEAKDAVDAFERGEPLIMPAAPAVVAERRAPGSGIDDPELREHLAAHRLIEAIKRYRELTGVGLKDAKDAIEAFQRGEPLSMPAVVAVPQPTDSAIDDPELREHLAADRLVDAIKCYRELTGLGLKESKDAIEALRESHKS